MTAMKDLIEYVARSIVDDPTQVRVTEVKGGASVILELTVAPEDMGRVIGRRGRAATQCGLCCACQRQSRESALL